MAALLTTSSPYSEFLAELDEIQRHKWYLSEQAGLDVGFEKALNDWVTHHRISWRRMRTQVQDNGESSLP
ncbi:MAG: DUF4032 domain-containing protein [Prosthecobacter sp.]